LIALAFLFLLIFFIPRNAGERMGFGVSVLLSITVYLLVISDKLPEKSDSDPMLGIIFNVEFIVLCLALALAACNIKLSQTQYKPPPKLLLRMLRIKHDDVKQKVSENNFTDYKDPLVTLSMVKLRRLNNNKNIPTIAENTEDYNLYLKQWSKVADSLDRIYMIAFFIIIIVIPVIIVVSLDKSGLA